MQLSSKSATILLTGGAGFIGCNILRFLNKKGYTNIIVVDDLTQEKKRNIHSLQYKAFYEKEDLLTLLKKKQLEKIDVIIHMGACSDTGETDRAFLKKNNFDYSKKLFLFAKKNKCQFIYASSASVYGNGKKGYSESAKNLRPLNLYGYYKLQFDTWLTKQKEKPMQWVGLRFFNVYGPWEYHKGKMASVVYHGFRQIQQTGKMKLFKSYKKQYKDGMQLRDFIYVKDVVSVIDFFLEHPEKSGIFNVGTGKTESFLTLAKATFFALRKKPEITFIAMPEALRTRYQYFTQADINRLRKTGYKKKFTPLQKGVEEYVTKYLRQLT